MSSTKDTPRTVEQLQVKLLGDQAVIQAKTLELQRRTEAAELANRQFHGLFDSLPLPALVVDEDCHVIQANALARLWFGGAERDVVSLRQTLGKQEWTELLEALRRAAHEGHAALPKLPIPDPGNHIRSVDLIISRVGSEYNHDPSFSILMMDRTTEMEVDADRHIFEGLLSGTEDMIYAVDASGRLLLVNRAFAKNYGAEVQDLEGCKRQSFMPLKDAIAQDFRDSQVAHSGISSTEEEEVHSALGEGRLQVLAHRFPLRDQHQQVIGVGGILRDISSEYKTRHHTLMAEAVFVNSTEAIIVADAEARIQRVNPAFERLTGYSATSVVGQRTSLLRSGRQDRNFYRAMWQQLNEVGRWEGELVNRHASGALFTVWAHIVALRDVQKRITGYIAVEADVSQLRSAQTLLERLATYDNLTGLPNRNLVADRLDKLIALSVRQAQPFAVLFCDLDHFKEVNDSLGHQVGDELLRTLAERMCAALRAQDTVSRWGGDEFLLLLPGADGNAARHLAQKIQQRISEPLELPGMSAYRPQCSFGVAVFPDDGATADMLIRSADTAMYAAKAAGRARVSVYSQDMGKAMSRSFDLSNALKHAVQASEFVLHIQPKFLLETGEMCGGEALIRWERPGVGLVNPGDFLPVAERTGLLLSIDRWVITKSVQLLAEWAAEGRWPEDWSLAVNQTSADIQQPGYADDIEALFQAVKVRPAHFEIEINEGSLVQPSLQVMETLNALRRLGLTLSIDDFGTGYSSLAYLKELPIDVIKIDQTFVRNMLTSKTDRTLVEAMVTLGHKMGYKAVAEGIETDAQLDMLKRLGCKYGQGYLIGRPMPVQQFERLLRLPGLSQV